MYDVIRNSYLIKNAKAMRPVFIQLLFVWLAFFLMASVSYLFVKDIVHGYLVKDAKYTLSYMQSRIATDLLEAETTLQSVSQSVRSMILRKNSEDDVLKYITEISDYLFSNEIRTSAVSGIYGIFDIFEGIFLDGSGWVPPPDYKSEERPWYKVALEANGNIAFSPPYVDLYTKEVIITYSRRIFDNEGKPLGVICVDAQLNKIGKYVANTSLAKGGYGLLLSADLDIIASPDREMIGKQLTVLPSTNALDIVEDLKKGIDLHERVVINNSNESFVIFSKKIENEWQLGLLTPVEQYYQEVTNMRHFIIVLGVILALLLSFILLRIAVEKQKADNENRQKSSFLATMSHEMRTPMNAILGISEIQLQEKTLADSSKEAFRKIYNSGYLLLGLINDVLDLSKIEAGKMELIPVEYHVASLINDTVQLNMMRIEDKPIEVSLYVDENIPSILFGDELRVKRILNNLLSNAFKYTKKGIVKISILAEFEKEKKQVMLIFNVSDTGQGMTEQQLSKLFDEYARFNLEVNQSTEGSGLGMSITKRLIQMMKGKIFVNSKLGEGSIFTVHLPQITTNSKPLGIEVAQNLKNFSFISTTNTKKRQIIYEYMPYGKVLIVDDLETNLYVAKGFMLPYELFIDTALSGFEAIEKIKAGNIYDIIFMDHMMPGMDGIEATKIIRGMCYKHPILALTANAVVGQAEVFLKNGFDGFISKPIDISELNNILNKFIRDKQPHEVIENARKQKRETLKQPLKGVDSELLSIFTKEAKKAIETLKALEKQDISDEDLHTYTIVTHSMKSALANIGETELSAFALKLEEAGRKRNINIINAKTPEFLNVLNSVICKIAPKDDDKAVNEDPVYLREKLLAIKTACMEFNRKAAKDAIDELKHKDLSHSTKEKLAQIAEHILHSDFEESIAAIDDICKS